MDLTAEMFLKNYIEELSGIGKEIDAAEFDSFVEDLFAAYQRDSHIFVCGNGGSASTSSHFACDVNKHVKDSNGRRFRTICLNDNIPLMMAYANDVSYEDVFVEQIKNFLRPDDLVVCFSGSGNSKNVLKTVEFSNRAGARTFGICGFGGGRLKELAQKSVVVKSTDMQKVEDIHMMLTHCALQYLQKRVNP